MMDIKTRVKNLKPTFLGKFLYTCVPIRRQVALSNMRLVFGRELSESEIRHLAKAFYSHLAKTFLENLILGWMSEDQIRKKIRVEGIHHLMAAAKLERGILLLTGHFGNWELAPMGGILHFEEFRGRLHILRRQLVNKTVERILFRRFYQMGLDVIPKKSSLGRVMDALSKNDTVAFIMDQYAKPGKEGILVDFFGKEAGTFKSLAMVARSTNSPVLPAASWREPDGKHVFKFFDPISWVSHDDPDEEILINTRNYNQKIEEFILEHPEQWLWIHKRWKVKKAHQKVAVSPK